MPKDLLSGLKPDAKLSRNGFDWSGRDVMSWQLGALYPIWNKSLIPNEDVRINVNHLLRTFPMSAPNFNRCRAHFEFYFVPYNQIWKNYDQFYTQRDDRQSVRTMNASTVVPCFDVVLLKRLAATDILNKFDTTTHTLNFADDIHRFHGAPNALRLMDLLGYGSVLGYQNGFSDLLPENPNDNVRTAFLNSFGLTGRTYLNVFKAAAYQKIWASYYRDSVHDTYDYRDVFNFDDCNLSGVNDVNLNDDAHDVTKLFTQRYRCYKKDIFTGSYPSQQFGDISSVSFNEISINDGSEENGGAVQTNDYGDLESFAGSTNWNVPSAFDVYQFYRAEAVQLWRERVMRAGNRYRDNYKAHFGVVPKFLEDDYPEFVGSFSKLITVDDVTSTAETSEGVLGALAGKGIAADQTENISYHCRDFGVLMCMFSIVPEMDYNATGIDKDNCALRFEDFIVPEFDRLGFQPIEQKERITNQPHIGFVLGSSGDSAQAFTFNENNVLGHNVRFYNHKGRVNKVHGRFQFCRVDWSISGLGRGNDVLYNGDLSPFVMPTEDYIVTTELVPLSRYYISPRMCDPMFSVRSDGTELTDRFFGAVQVNCDDVAPLSRSGLHAI